MTSTSSEPYIAGSDEVYGGGWRKLMMILARDDVSELKVNKYQDGVFVVQNGKNTLVPKVGWGGEAGFFNDFEQTVFPSMHASGFEDDKGKPLRPRHLRYLYEGALIYAVTNSHNERTTIHARLHMVLKPTVDDCPAVTIAKRSESLTTLQSMIDNGTMNRDIADFLRRAIITKQTIVFSAGSGCGKTTMLRACGKYFDPMERVLVAEDSPELTFDNVKDVVYMQSTPWRPGLDTNQVVSLAYIVSLFNRQRGTRCIVGECRSKEIHGFLQAANSGMPGSATTFHANSPQECLDRISMLDSEAEPGRDIQTINKAIAYAIDFIVQLARDDQGHHWVETITEVSNIVSKDTGIIATSDIFKHTSHGFENHLDAMSDTKRRAMGYM